MGREKDRDWTGGDACRRRECAKDGKSIEGVRRDKRGKIRQPASQGKHAC